MTIQEQNPKPMKIQERNPKPMKNIAYRMMSYLLRHMKPKQFVEDLLRRSHVVSGATVLDYACGPGVFTIPAAKIVRPGYVYAADIHPFAIMEVEAAVKREHLENVKTIQTHCLTGLPDNSIDVVLLFDCFHHFKDPGLVLAELHRVLKVGGFLSLQVDHGAMSGPTHDVEATGLFLAVDHEAHGKLRLFTARK